MVGELGLDYSGSRQKKKVGFVSMEMNFGFHKIRKMPSLAAELLKKDYALWSSWLVVGIRKETS